MNRRLTGAVIIILLLFSVLGSIYLAVRQQLESPRTGLARRTAVSPRSVGVIDIYGPVQAGRSAGDIFAQDELTRITSNIRRFRRDHRIKAVILRINSPGGTVGAIQEIISEIERVRESGKPVVASIADIGASGGYYLASACDKVVVNPGSITGGIGVMFIASDMSGLLERVGVNVEVIKSGPFKDTGSFHRSFTPQERSYLQELIDDAYSQFIDQVSRGRDMSREEVGPLARGQVFTGRQAVDNGLADRLGDTTTAHSVAEELAGVTGTKMVRVPVRRLGRFFGLLNLAGRFDVFGQGRISGLAYLYRH